MTSKLRNLLYLFVLVCLASAVVLYADPGDDIDDFLMQRSVDRALVDYVDKNVVATLSRLVDELQALEAAAHRLHAEPTDANLAAAASAWRAARATWQLTTPFEFGPAAQYNFDKQLGAWPLDRPLVEYTLTEMAAGRLTLDATYLRERVYSTRRGFLAAEYLLFRDGRPRPARDLRPAELDYLAVTTEVMRLEGTDFLAAWIGTDALSPAQAEALAAAGFAPRTAYADEFTRPGHYASRYPSASAPLQEIMQDAITVAEELCPAIDEVLDSDDPHAGETWYSHNGLADLQGILQGLENAYLGGLAGTRGRSVSDLVARLDGVLDRRIRIALADTAYRIAAAGESGPAAPRALEVRRAVSACEKLAARITVAVPLVTMHPSALPWAIYGVYDMPSTM
ncbi:Imelysin [Thioflavicoccus mobilis 8321]|uniref:Imelysin n=1 Tax=Thioflavicoccus mobilis 8321 TaxID=765912 RepID=L0GUL2_9GAMM|nr:imelysin family protein [Thioflavicoccus mobilis]AGA89502.1 Imelysin [Thioflavicoccus mobilis 8321]